MNYYQITWEEILEPDKEWTAIPEPAPERGLIDYFCPVCSDVVGIYSTGTIHEKGWMYRRETCRNGHKIRYSRR